MKYKAIFRHEPLFEETNDEIGHWRYEERIFEAEDSNEAITAAENLCGIIRKECGPGHCSHSVDEIYLLDSGDGIKSIYNDGVYRTLSWDGQGVRKYKRELH